MGVSVEANGVVEMPEISCLLGDSLRAAEESVEVGALFFRPVIREVIFLKPLGFEPFRLLLAVMRSTSFSSNGVMVRFRMVRLPIL